MFKKMKTLPRVRRARVAEIAEFVELNSKNIPDRQICVGLQKSEKVLNHSTLAYGKAFLAWVTSRGGGGDILGSDQEVRPATPLHSWPRPFE